MFNWVKKIVKTISHWTTNQETKAKNVTLNLRSTSTPKNMVDMNEIPEIILKFHENVEWLKALEVKELKEMYKSLWWKPNNFINDRYAIIYLISRLQVKHDWE